MREGDISQFSQLLYEAPFAVLAHDAAEEQRFTYANKAAQDLFEGSWEDIVGMKSKDSAEPEKEVRGEAREEGRCGVGVPPMV